jgi:hypothetical protein
MVAHDEKIYRLGRNIDVIAAKQVVATIEGRFQIQETGNTSQK